MTALIMAYAVMVILVSPAVPSPMTTVPSKHTVHPPQFVAPVTALLFTSALDAVRALHLLGAEPVRVAARGSNLLDLTNARLC